MTPWGALEAPPCAGVWYYSQSDVTAMMLEDDL